MRIFGILIAIAVAAIATPAVAGACQDRVGRVDLTGCENLPGDEVVAGGKTDRLPEVIETAEDASAN